MSDKPNAFVVTNRGDENTIERRINLHGDDFIEFRITTRINGVPDPTLQGLQNASAAIVIRHLLTLLPEDFQGNPFVPGPRKPQQ